MTESWISCFERRPRAELRLVCFPYAGGSSLAFRKWSDILPKSVEIVAIQLPGRATRLSEPPFSNLRPLVSAIVENTLDLFQKPFAIYGHSMGALLGFEVARAIRSRTSAQPVHLFVGAHSAPHLPHSGLRRHDLPEAEFWESMKDFGPASELLQNEELKEMLLPILRADFALRETYTYRSEPPLACPITAVGGEYDSHVERGWLEAWRQHTSNRFSLHMVPGTHLFVDDVPAPLTRIIVRKLAEGTDFDLADRSGSEHSFKSSRNS